MNGLDHASPEMVRTFQGMCRRLRKDVEDLSSACKAVESFNPVSTKLEPFMEAGMTLKAELEKTIHSLQASLEASASGRHNLKGEQN